MGIVNYSQGCVVDYLMVSNMANQTFGKYCGSKETGKTIWVTGQDTVITFHSDHSLQFRGFLIRFVASGE